MNRREFIIQYTLNRSLGNKGGLDGPTAAREGARAWDEIEKLAPTAQFGRPRPPIASDLTKIQDFNV